MACQSFVHLLHQPLLMFDFSNIFLCRYLHMVMYEPQSYSCFARMYSLFFGNVPYNFSCSVLYVVRDGTNFHICFSLKFFCGSCKASLQKP